MSEKNERAMRECGQVGTKLGNLIDRLEKDCAVLDKNAIVWTMLGGVLASLRDGGTSRVDLEASLGQVVDSLYAPPPTEEEAEEHEDEARRH